VALKFLRGEAGKKPVEKTVSVTLDTLPDDLARKGGTDKPDEGSVSGADSLDGVEVADLDAQARRQFGVPPRIQGALVSNVEQDSNAAGAGLQPGDVILELNRQPVRNADNAVTLSNKAKGDRVLLRLWRGGSSFFLSVDNTKKK
jgi:serine protease Do